VSEDSEVIAALLAEPASALLAVDFDGTLAGIVDRPEDARPADGASEVLARLAARLAGVAVISGRPAEDVVRLLGLDDASRVAVLGHYGMQTWRGGRLESPPPDAAVADARDLTRAVVATAGDGVTVEDKGHSVAVHTRRSADPAAMLAALTPRLQEIAEGCGLEAVPGRYVLELRPPGSDKGTALRTLVDDLAPRVVVYVGDDAGDLPAYAVVDALSDAGEALGLTVASVDPAAMDAPPEVAARAGMVVAGPDALVAWLAGIAELLG
jgi:trehalose 6-phosphate phosphatase